jgi:cyclopropane-fatty-acyl-phospholipid synthase
MANETSHGITAAAPAAQRSSTTSSPATTVERWLLRVLLRLMRNAPLRFALWDGTCVGDDGGNTPVATLRVANRRTLWRLLANPGLNFGDDYSAGLIEVEGDLVRFIEAVYLAAMPSPNAGLLERYAVNRPTRIRRNTLAGSRRHIHHHYDLGNDFYRLWLDEEMVYTCAYFPQPEVSLEAAQLAKMEHVCRKLRLRAGESVVEAGCGWGSLALYMARHYGVKVQAYNVSHEQIEYARERARREGLDGQVTFNEDDYRNIAGTHDVFVSVGMLEHVGRDHHAELGRVIDRCLSRTGRGLIHSISQRQPRPVNAWLERRIFPGGYPPTLREIVAILEPIDCVVNDVEDLRQHYARTLEHWLARFDQHADKVRAMYDEAFVRAWRLYLAASIANFTTNSLQLYQVLFTRPALTDTPWTRAHLYADDSSR